MTDDYSLALLLFFLCACTPLAFIVGLGVSEPDRQKLTFQAEIIGRQRKQLKHYRRLARKAWREARHLNTAIKA